MIHHRVLAHAARAFHAALLHTAALAVPGPQRAEWLCEWSAELWHVRAACLAPNLKEKALPAAFSWTAQSEITAFCLGAFADAACLRRDQPQAGPAAVAIHDSARQCLLTLGVVAALCAVLAHLLPGVRNERDATRTPLPANLLVIGRATGQGPVVPSISPAQFRLWKSHRQTFFKHIAYYRLEEIHAVLSGAGPLKWTVAHATADLFPMLGITLAGSAAVDSLRPQAVLSQAAWRDRFHADPDILGAVLSLGTRKVQIAAIAPAGTWRVPGNPDLFLLDSEAALARNPAAGYLIASLPASTSTEMSAHSFAITAAGPENSEILLRGDPMVLPASGPVAIYWFALFLAVLALPAITSVSSADNHFSSYRPSLRARLNRWSLLTGKILLIAAIAWFAALDLAYAPFPDFSPAAEFLQFAAAFTISLFGLRWALRDQSQRCPVCLRRVTHPAQVGIASCTFLGWNGTEMMCTAGHALLHVPSLPTSWFSQQRWTYLDPTWDFLFADTTLRP